MKVPRFVNGIFCWELSQASSTCELACVSSQARQNMSVATPHCEKFVDVWRKSDVHLRREL